MSTNSSPYSVVVAVDFSPHSAQAVRLGLAIASSGPHHELHLVHVIPAAGGLTTAARVRNQEVKLEEMSDVLRDYFQHTIKEAPTPEHPPAIGFHVRVGKPSDGIVQLAADLQAGMIVVGTHGREGFEHMLFGSVAEKVVRRARCPVLVAHSVDYGGVAPEEQIEPPCQDCLAKRQETNGQTWWCEMHSRPRPASHVYSASANWSTTHDSEVRATGIDW